MIRERSRLLGEKFFLYRYKSFLDLFSLVNALHKRTYQLTIPSQVQQRIYLIGWGLKEWREKWFDGGGTLSVIFNFIHEGKSHWQAHNHSGMPVKTKKCSLQSQSQLFSPLECSGCWSHLIPRVLLELLKARPFQCDPRHHSLASCLFTQNLLSSPYKTHTTTKTKVRY